MMTDNSTDTPKKKWMTLDEVATYTGRSYNTIHSWVTKGKLPTSQPGGKGGVHMIDVGDVDRLIAPKPKDPKKDGDT